MSNLRSPGFGGTGVRQNFKPLHRADLCESISGGQVDYAFLKSSEQAMVVSIGLAEKQNKCS